MKPQASILFWLLVVATVAVNVVTIARFDEEGPLSRIVYVYDALVTAQLAIACIWAKFSPRPAWLKWVGALAAVTVGALLGWWFADLELAESFGIYGSFAVVLTFTLWLLGGTRWWQRATSLGSSSWRFSLGQLIGVMTLVAVLTTVLRASNFLFGEYPVWQILIVMTLSDVLVVVATLGLWSQAWNWVFRLAASIGVAAAIGVVQTASANLGLFGPSVVSSIENDLAPDLTYRIILAAVLFAGLELGSIIPIDRRAETTPPAGERV